MALAIDPARKLPVAIVVAVAMMVGTLGVSEWLKPSRMMADELEPIVIESLVPKQFGDWRLDNSGMVVVTDPTVEATLKQFYSQTLTRTYVNSKGEAVMLSLAYGKNQNSWNTAAHRPEFCYRAQGFEVSERGPATLHVNGRDIDALRLVATRGPQVEPITYWVTLHDTTAVPGMSRKLQQVKYGLQGMIVDGFLVRLSSLGKGEAEQFSLQEKFARDLEMAMSASQRPRLFGNK